MRWLLAPVLVAVVLAAETPSPVVAELLRHVPPEQAQSLGPLPKLRDAAAAVPDLRRDAARAMLIRLERGATPRTLVELTHAYLYLAQPAEAERVSRLVQAAMPGVEGLAFRAWAAQQAGDNDGAAEAARAALKLAPGRPDLVAILKLTEGRTKADRTAAEPTKTPVPSSPSRASSVLANNARRREAERALAEAVRARKVGDVSRARGLVQRAIELDPNSSELRDLLVSLSAPATPDTVAAMTLLRTSPTGKEVAEFIEKEKISIRIANELPGSSAATYDLGSRTIFLGPEFNSEPAVSQALQLGHEGYHAIQHIRHSMAPVIEAEQDAWLRTMVIYDELIQLGNPELPAVHFISRYVPDFRQTIKRRSPKNFYDFIWASYRAETQMRRDADLRASPESWLLLRAVNVPAYMRTMSARALRYSPSGIYFYGWRNLSNTIIRHDEEEKWFADWLSQRPSR